jgi:hypothetical protein
MLLSSGPFASVFAGVFASAVAVPSAGFEVAQWQACVGAQGVHTTELALSLGDLVLIGLHQLLLCSTTLFLERLFSKLEPGFDMGVQHCGPPQWYSCACRVWCWCGDSAHTVRGLRLCLGVPECLAGGPHLGDFYIASCSLVVFSN